MSQIQSGAILSYLSIFLSSIISLAYTPIMLRLLGQSEYGLMSIANSVIGYLGLLNLGLGSAMVRYITRFKTEGNKVMEHSVFTLFLSLYSIIAFISIIIGLLLAYNTNGLFNKSLSFDELKSLQVLMCLITFNIAISMVSSVFYAVLMAHERFIFTKLMGIINTIITPLIMLPILWIGYKAIGITVASTILNIVNSVIIIYYCFTKLKIRITFKRFDNQFIKELSGFSFYVLLAMIVDKVYWGTDQFILGATTSAVTVAIYNVGANFTTYFMSFSTAISGLFLPKITQMDIQKVNNEEYTYLFIRVGRIQFLILGLILGGFILLGHDFICLWAGKNYNQSYWIALVILVPFIIPLIQNIGLQIMYARNKHKFRSLLLFFIAIVNVLLSIPAAKHYGGLGCALITGSSFIIGQIIILNWYYYKHLHINIKAFWKEISKLILILSILIIVLKVLNLDNCNNWNILLLNATIYFFIYIICMWLWGMKQYEKTIITNIFKKVKIKI